MNEHSRHPYTYNSLSLSLFLVFATSNATTCSTIFGCMQKNTNDSYDDGDGAAPPSTVYYSSSVLL